MVATSPCQGQVKFKLYRDPVSGCVSQKKIRELVCSLGHCQPNDSSPLVHRSLDARFTGGAHVFIGTNAKSAGKSYRSVGGCCRPDRFQLRTLRLVCADGSDRLAEVKLARRCACSTNCDTS